MKKGLAIETLMKLLICIVVVGIVFFLIYKFVSPGALGERECSARMTAWCVHCQMANWVEGPKMGKELGECASKYWGFGSEGQICTNFKDKCRGFLPSEG